MAVDTSEYALEDIASLWDDNADYWAYQVRAGHDIYRDHFNNPAFFNFIGDIKGKKILDAGCGEGTNTRLLARQGGVVTAIDISEKLIAYAHQAEDEKPLGITYQVASYTNLSIFRDMEFDAVISTMALMDGPDFDQAFSEFHRVLKSPGDMFFSILHPCFMTRGLDWLEGKEIRDNTLLVSHYFEGRPWIDKWKFSHSPDSGSDDFVTTCYYSRTLTDYINGVINAGFNLVKIDEPRPSEAACTKFPAFGKWRDHAAIFLYVHARKTRE
ncbi:MAG: methyltransferase domain-containing protein [candidate division Zixibacteria bacterium]|nr:methyltransferase domain-containing protein [candidate division Zixibacteria bacterium]